MYKIYVYDQKNNLKEVLEYKDMVELQDKTAQLLINGFKVNISSN